MNVPEKYSGGGRVYLRLMTSNDINDEYITWFQDMGVTEFLDARNISKDDALSFLREGQVSGKWVQYAICLSESGMHIGNLKVGPISKPHLLSDMVTVLGHRDAWGKGLATEAIRLGVKMAFEEFGLRKLSAGVVEGNWGSVKCYTRAGWVVEGVLRGQYLSDGQAKDRICIACFNPTYFDVKKIAALMPKFDMPMVDAK